MRHALTVFLDRVLVPSHSGEERTIAGGGSEVELIVAKAGTPGLLVEVVEPAVGGDFVSCVTVVISNKTGQINVRVDFVKLSHATALVEQIPVLIQVFDQILKVAIVVGNVHHVFYQHIVDLF